MKRVVIDQDPFAPEAPDFKAVAWRRPDYWPGCWITHPDPPEVPFVMAYRLKVDLKQPFETRVHVSGDERYALYLDGELVGRGPERGGAAYWHFESFDMKRSAGKHVLVALVWSLGKLAPVAQMSVKHGFLLVPEDSSELLATGVAPWECRQVTGLTFHPAGWVGPCEEVDGTTYPWGIESGGGDDWMPAEAGEHALPAQHAETPQNRHLLQPALLPAQYRSVVKGLVVREAKGTEVTSWQALCDGVASLTLPPKSHCEVLIDCDDYVCVFPSLTVSGGAGSQIELAWAEALFMQEKGSNDKGNRDEVAGKHWRGRRGSILLPDGGEKRRFGPLWWRSGRYLRMEIETGNEPLVVDNLTLTETRYPLEQSSRFTADLPELQKVWPILLRGLQMCSHETYMDCPYYEQLQYVGDTRLEALTTYVLTPDASLPRKAVLSFDASRIASGFTQSRFPCRDMQIIPPFSLWWICMVRDYAWWRDDPKTVTAVLPGVRAVIQACASRMGQDGLLKHLPGWNFIDWVQDDHWHIGVPDDGGAGTAAPLQWQWILTLQAAVALEEHVGNACQAAYDKELLEQAMVGVEAFWDPCRSLYANDLAKTHHSEHANCLALCSGGLPVSRQEETAAVLFAEHNLPRASIYYGHYYLEAARTMCRADAFHRRLREWYDLVDNGFRTPRESPEPSRSDCHGWGSHPIFHAFASLLGIRPTAPGFAELRVDPLPGQLRDLSGELPHPKGIVRVEVRGNQISVDAPEGVVVRRS
ncbi:MAG: alpha-L-rhamnosidase [Lentisphaeria bacterium]|nr:alpha-L-rhamnosidase [Lentisphaeria bacterium]